MTRSERILAAAQTCGNACGFVSAAETGGFEVRPGVWMVTDPGPIARSDMPEAENVFTPEYEPGQGDFAGGALVEGPGGAACERLGEHAYQRALLDAVRERWPRVRWEYCGPPRHPVAPPPLAGVVDGWVIAIVMGMVI